MWIFLGVVFVICTILAVRYENKKNAVSNTRYVEKYYEDNELIDNETRLKYQKVKQDTETWNAKYNIISNMRLKAIDLEKSGALQEAINTYIKSIKLCNADPEFDGFSFTGYAINRVIILYYKTKQIDLLKQFLEYNINKYPDHAYIEGWDIRLEKLNNPTPDITLPQREDVSGIINSNKTNTIGYKFSKYKQSLPEFNFYYDLPEGTPTSYYQNIPITQEMEHSFKEYRDAFKIIKNEAQVAEKKGEYNIAIPAYERMIQEGCEDTFPYERLMILYKKIGWKDYEESVIKRGILFFSNLKEKQRKYVMGLAKKYNMESKALEYINSGKKIFYYMGLFELYNPYPIIEKWKKRLNKHNNR